MERRPVLRDDVRPLAALKVRADQPRLVTDNALTLAEARYETGSYVWGLWAGDTVVGLMAMVHPAEYPWHLDGDDTEAAYLWRLMIGQRFRTGGMGAGPLLLRSHRRAIGAARDWWHPSRTSRTAISGSTKSWAFGALGPSWMTRSRL